MPKEINKFLIQFHEFDEFLLTFFFVDQIHETRILKTYQKRIKFLGNKIINPELIGNFIIEATDQEKRR